SRPDPPPVAGAALCRQRARRSRCQRGVQRAAAADGAIADRLLARIRQAGSGGVHAIVRRMLDRALHFLPALRELQALRIWTGQRPDSIDGLPYIGRVPQRVDLWVAAGHEGLGVTTSLGTARLLVDQFLGRVPALDPAPYDPARVLA